KEIAGQSSGVKSGAVREWDGCERRFVPVFLEEDYSPEAIAKRYKNFSATGAEVSIANSSLLLSFSRTGCCPGLPKFCLICFVAFFERWFPWQGPSDRDANRSPLLVSHKKELRQAEMLRPVGSPGGPHFLYR
ncbi:MAG: hypothetical protein OK454_03620, partial [Thaumarchaeota archaeon]|nr:hypothetical protein [Nitrososphaerota archaeon]